MASRNTNIGPTNFLGNDLALNNENENLCSGIVLMSRFASQLKFLNLIATIRKLEFKIYKLFIYVIVLNRKVHTMNFWDNEVKKFTSF